MNRYGLFMGTRERGHRNFHTGTSWLLLILLLCLSGRCFGQTYNNFSYSVIGSAVAAITGYSGPGGAVAIPSSIPGVGTVTSIGNDAFFECIGLTSVTIPSSVTDIGLDAFKFCTTLQAITVDPQNTAYSSLNGVLFDKSQSLLIEFPAGAAGAYTIPNGVTSFADDAFAACGNLTSVTLPNSLTSIGGGAFQSGTSLTSVSMGNSVTSIGSWAFQWCTNLTSVTIPAGVTSIG